MHLHFVKGAADSGDLAFTVVILNSALDLDARASGHSRMKFAGSARQFSVRCRSALAEFRYRPFHVLLGLGFLIRLIVMLAYWPAVMLSFDSPRYARVGMPLFGDFWMPAGYPIFLHLVRFASHQLWFTIAVQHVLGITVGMLVFVCLRRLRITPPFCCLAAAVPLLSGDCLYLEHQVMADSFFLFVVVVGLTVAVFGLVGCFNVVRLGAAGALLMFSALVRSVGIALPAVLVLTLLLVTALSTTRRIRAVGAALSGAGGVFLSYFAAFAVDHGQYLGLSDMTGWNVYSRIAPFADCAKFTAPHGTELLCDSRPPSERPGPFGYVWDLDSVSRRNFALGPESGRLLQRFAIQTLLHQPGDYLKAVAIDLARYVAPHFAARPYSGQPAEILSFGWRDLNVERQVVSAMKVRYRGVRITVCDQELLPCYQSIMRVHGVLLVGLLFCSLAGAAIARRDEKIMLCLWGLSAFLLYLVPVLTCSYDFRYGIPPQTLLAMSGMTGLAILWRHFDVPRRISR